ncbi:MAG TPA: PLDc N-terminal domain-containing protein [bacterium]|nr:PLDc N-terminal domain-containing protein [bacterium]
MICTLNNQIIPCHSTGSLPQAFFFLPFLMIPLAIFAIVFWVMMLVDAVKHQKENKEIWIIIICLTQFCGAVIYYFAAKRNRKTKNK